MPSAGYLSVLWWDSEMKNCKICLFRNLRCVCVLCSVSRSCPTLCDLMDFSPPGSSVHGIFQTSILKWVAISSSMGKICIQMAKKQRLYGENSKGGMSPFLLRNSPFFLGMVYNLCHVLGKYSYTVYKIVYFPVFLFNF